MKMNFQNFKTFIAPSIGRAADGQPKMGLVKSGLVNMTRDTQAERLIAVFWALSIDGYGSESDVEVVVDTESEGGPHYCFHAMAMTSSSSVVVVTRTGAEFDGDADLIPLSISQDDAHSMGMPIDVSKAGVHTLLRLACFKAGFIAAREILPLHIGGDFESVSEPVGTIH